MLWSSEGVCSGTPGLQPRAARFAPAPRRRGRDRWQPGLPDAHPPMSSPPDARRLNRLSSATRPSPPSRPPRSPHHGLGRSCPRSRRAAAAIAQHRPPLPPRPRARTITGPASHRPGQCHARLAHFEPVCCPIAHFLLTRPRPQPSPNGCLFLHTARGGGASYSTQTRLCATGASQTPFSACLRPNLTNGGADQ